MNTGENIKKYRKKKGLSQRKLSILSGVSHTQIANYEKNNTIPTLETLGKIAKGLDIPISLLMPSRFNVYNIDKSNELINLYSKGIIRWVNEDFLTYRESEFLLSHYAELLLRYKSFMEHAAYSIEYWDQNNDDIKEGYLKINKDLTEKEIEELYYKQHLENDVKNLHNWIDSFVGNYLRDKEEKIDE